MTALTWRSPIQCFIAACLSFATLVGCALDDVEERVNRFTTAEPSQRKLRVLQRLTLASAYFEQDQIEASLQEVRATLLIDPAEPQAYNLLGLIYQRQGQVQLAQQSFEQALQLLQADPHASKTDRAAIEHNYAWWLCEQQQYVAAQVYFEKALSQSTTVARIKTWQALGICALNAGHADQARSYFESILKIQPDHPLALYQLASLDYSQGDLQHAQTRLEQLHRTAYISAQSLRLGIRIAKDLGQTQQQLALEQRLSEDFPQARPVDGLLPP